VAERTWKYLYTHTHECVYIYTRCYVDDDQGQVPMASPTFLLVPGFTLVPLLSGRVLLYRMNSLFMSYKRLSKHHWSLLIIYFHRSTLLDLHDQRLVKVGGMKYTSAINLDSLSLTSVRVKVFG